MRKSSHMYLHVDIPMSLLRIDDTKQWRQLDLEADQNIIYEL